MHSTENMPFISYSNLLIDIAFLWVQNISKNFHLIWYHWKLPPIEYHINTRIFKYQSLSANQMKKLYLDEFAKKQKC